MSNQKVAEYKYHATRQVILDLLTQVGIKSDNFGVAQIQVDAAIDRIAQIWDIKNGRPATQERKDILSDTPEN